MMTQHLEAETTEKTQMTLPQRRGGTTSYMYKHPYSLSEDKYHLDSPILD